MLVFSMQLVLFELVRQAAYVMTLARPPLRLRRDRMLLTSMNNIIAQPNHHNYTLLTNDRTRYEQQSTITRPAARVRAHEALSNLYHKPQ